MLKDKRSYSSGCVSLDIALGARGFIGGHINEILGDYDSGKSTVAFLSIASVQKLGGLCAYVQPKEGVDEIWSEVMGVDLEQLSVIDADPVEASLKTVNKLIESKRLSLVVIDTSFLLFQKDESEKSDSDYAAYKDRVCEALAQFRKALTQSECGCLLINRSQIPSTDSGRSSILSFPADKELVVNKSVIDEDEFRLNVSVSSPDQDEVSQAELVIHSKHGLSAPLDIICAGVAAGVVTNENGGYQYNEVRYSSQQEFMRVIEGNSYFAEELLVEIFTSLGMSKS